MEPRINFQDVPKGLFDSLIRTGFHFKQSKVDHKTLELVKNRVSQINGCAFCLDMHYKDAIHLGETPVRIYSLPAWKECPYYTEKERAAIALSEALTNGHQLEVSDELYATLSAHFSKEEIAELTIAISLTNTWNRINKAFLTTPGNYQPGQF